MDNTIDYVKNESWDEKKSLLENYYASLEQVRAFVSSLGIPLKYSGYFAMIPSNFDVDRYLREHNILNYKFVKDNTGNIKSVNSNGTVGSYFDKYRLIYIIGLLSSIPAKNKDSITEDGYVPINSILIRNVFKDYLPYLDYLILTGVITTDGQYVQGKKSKGYKFTERYIDAPLVRYYYPAFQASTVEAIPSEVFSEEDKRFIPNSVAEYPYLANWYQTQKLHIEESSASSYAWLIMQKKFREGKETWDINKDKSNRGSIVRKYPLTQYHAILHNIGSIAIGNYKVSIDTNVHRLHSAITNMQKDYRNFLTYDKKSLVNIDIANSQPFILCLLLNPLFWDKHSNLSLNIGMLPYNTQKRFPEEQISSIINYLRELESGQIQDYITKASKGEIYNYMVDVLNDSSLGASYDKDAVKTMMLIAFFSSNRYFHQADAKLKRVFKSCFPAIYELIRLAKVNRKEDFACLLQSIESEIILHRCCRRIWEEGHHQVPVFTIHDSISTTTEHLEFVKNIMQEELTNAIGISPYLNTESWNLGNVKYPQLIQ